MTLVDKIEQADGPSRELDLEIHQWSLVVNLPKGMAISMPYIPMERVPYYTSSIDAALTLVPPHCLAGFQDLWDDGKKAAIGTIREYRMDEIGGRHWLRDHRAVAATPALALCAASLRARETSDG